MLPAPSRIHLVKSDVDVEQERLAVPASFAKSAPGHYQVEVRELPQHTLELKLVNPQNAPNSKRYRLIEHKRSHILSLPRYWLRDRSARPGDVLTIHEANGLLFIQWRQDLRQHKALIAQAPRDPNGELTPIGLVQHLRSHSVQFQQTDPLGQL